MVKWWFWFLSIPDHCLLMLHYFKYCFKSPINLCLVSSGTANQQEFRRRLDYISLDCICSLQVLVASDSSFLMPLPMSGYQGHNFIYIDCSTILLLHGFPITRKLSAFHKIILSLAFCHWVPFSKNVMLFKKAVSLVFFYYGSWSAFSHSAITQGAFQQYAFCFQNKSLMLLVLPWCLYFTVIKYRFPKHATGVVGGCNGAK